MLIIGLLGLLIAQQSAPAAAPPVSGEVVVTGQRYTNDYARCRAQNCPPEREVEAALRASVEQFREGRYDDARELLQRTISRNKKHASAMPERIADLFSTYADISLHTGHQRDYRSATYEAVSVLRDSLGSEHPNTIVTRLSIGDLLVQEGRPLAADEVYRDSVKQARAGGHRRLAALIAVRRAWLAVQMRADNRANEILDEITAGNGNDAALEPMVRAIRVRMALFRKDDATADRLIAEWRARPSARLTLLWEPSQPDMGGNVNFVRQGTQPDGSAGWVDVGYWVRPSGDVEQAEVLRPDGAESWARPIVKQIAGRRYAPFSRDIGDLGSYRIERVSMRQDFDIQMGSRIAQRGGQMKLIRADLTEQANDAAAATRKP